MFEDLKIVYWPDPRLLKRSKPVDVFDDSLHQLVQRMLVLMRESKGVGLAAPQVGINIRLFVMNHTGQPGDDRAYVNPVLSDQAGEEESEEGCLSLPGIHIDVLRSKVIRITAQDVDGRPVDQQDSGYLARIWQHETDHLDGILLTDRMSMGARLANRKILKDLEERYNAEHPAAAKKSLVAAGKKRHKW
ncbi:MAG: peptide deformylase [Bacillota bacterium]